MNLKIENIPEELKQKGKFCLHEEKIPKKIRYSKLVNASPNKEDDFASFDEIKQNYNQFKSDKVGIGIGFFDTICGIDLDNCIDEQGNICEIAKDILSRINSYSEKSISGKGLHIYFKMNPEEQFKIDELLYLNKLGEKQAKDKAKSDKRFENIKGIEIYQGTIDNRYFTLTGDTISKTNELSEIKREVLQSIFDDYMKKPEIVFNNNNNNSISFQNTQSDEEFFKIGIEKDQKLIELWNSTPSGSNGNESETDFALLTKLAYWTNKNEILMKQLFESSPYFQKKDELHKQKWYNRYDYQMNRFWKNYQGTTASQDNMNYMIERAVSKVVKGQIAPETSQNEPEKSFKLPLSAKEKTESFFESINKESFKPISTGMKYLDEKLMGGITNQSLVLLGGGTSVGKTTFVLNLIVNLAKERPVLYYTLEMSEEQILSKIFSHIAYKTGKMTISNTDILQSYDKNKMNDYQRENLLHEIESHEELNNIYIKFPESAQIDDIEKDIYSTTNLLKESGKEQPIIVIDYLQFIQGTAREDTQSLIKRIQRILKKYAIVENTFVILLFANSRQATTEGQESTISSGRDTSDIEYSSDYNFQLNFYEYEHEGKSCKKSVKELSSVNPIKMTLTIHKQRFGNRGIMLDYLFNGEANTFEEFNSNNSQQYKTNRI